MGSPRTATMWILPLFLAGAGVVLSFSPDATAFVSLQIGSMLPTELKSVRAATWVEGHQSLALMYLSLMLFFVTRTVSRVVDRQPQPRACDGTRRT